MTNVRMEHARVCGFCARGCRAWAARHNLDFKEFLANGLSIDVIEAVGDAFAVEVCKVARAAEAAQQNEANHG